MKQNFYLISGVEKWFNLFSMTTVRLKFFVNKSFCKKKFKKKAIQDSLYVLVRTMPFCADQFKISKPLNYGSTGHVCYTSSANVAVWFGISWKCFPSFSHSARIIATMWNLYECFFGTGKLSKIGSSFQPYRNDGLPGNCDKPRLSDTDS